MSAKKKGLLEKEDVYMSMFVGIEDEQGIIIYPRQLVRGKKKLLFVAFVSLFFVLLSLVILINGRHSTFGWQSFFLSVLSLFVSLIQLVWGAALVIDDETLSLRPNPFLPQIDVQWEEIASIGVSGKLYLALDFVLSPTHADAFLQRQSPFMKKILTRRIERTGRLAHFSHWVLPKFLLLPLLHLIKRRYHQQIEQHNIIIYD